MANARINPAHRNPPAETTPEEAERNKRIMGKNEARQEGPKERPDATDKTPNPGKATA